MPQEAKTPQEQLRAMMRAADAAESIAEGDVIGDPTRDAAPNSTAAGGTVGDLTRDGAPNATEGCRGRRHRRPTRRSGARHTPSKAVEAALDCALREGSGAEYGGGTPTDLAHPARAPPPAVSSPRPRVIIPPPLRYQALGLRVSSSGASRRLAESCRALDRGGRWSARG